MRTAGIVLCGGRSSRMGRAKAWLPFGNELMLPRIVRILRDAVDTVVVVAAANQDLPALPPDVSIVRDEIEGRGPLAGLAAGLAALVGKAEVAYVSSCDVPFLTAAFVRGVVGNAECGMRNSECENSLHSEFRIPHSEFVRVPHIDSILHPLAAAYRVDVLPHVREMLASDCLRMTDLFARVPTRFIEAAELTDLASLRNVNTPDEYEAALSHSHSH